MVVTVVNKARSKGEIKDFTNLYESVINYLKNL